MDKNTRKSIKKSYTNHEYRQVLNLANEFLGDKNDRKHYLQQIQDIPFPISKIIALSKLFLDFTDSAYTDFLRLYREHSSENPDPDVLQALACLSLLDRQQEDAVKFLLEKQNSAGKDTLAKKLLSYIKNNLNQSSLYTSKNIKQFYPPKPFHIPVKPVAIIFSCCLLAVFLGISGYYSWQYIDKNPNQKQGTIKTITLPDYNPNLLTEKQNAKYNFNEKQLQKQFSQIKNLVAAQKTNTAIILSNQIMRSNATVAVQEKIKILLKFLQPPDPFIFKNTVRIEDVKKDHLDYNDCYIKWPGKTINVKVNKQSIDFDFLVGYDANTVLEGLVKVRFFKSIIIKNNEQITLYGQIKSQLNGYYILGLGVIKN